MLFKQSYAHPVFRQRYDEWTWCFRCERVYHTARWLANHWFCPHPGCDGTARDSSRWHHTNEPPCDLNPQYPAVPVEGRLYASMRTDPEPQAGTGSFFQKPDWATRIAQRARLVMQEHFGQAGVAASYSMEVRRLRRQDPQPVLAPELRSGRPAEHAAPPIQTSQGNGGQQPRESL